MSFHESECGTDQGDAERHKKRLKLDDVEDPAKEVTTAQPKDIDSQHILPPSHSLLGIPLPVIPEGSLANFMETDVGISEYVSCGMPKVEGIIKQRFTDFLVNEIGLDGKVVHLNSLEKPESQKSLAKDEESRGPEEIATEPTGLDERYCVESMGHIPEESDSVKKFKLCESDVLWPESFNIRLAPFLSKLAISEVMKMYLEGPEPPLISDIRVESRTMPSEKAAESPEQPESKSNKLGRSGSRGDRGGLSRKTGRPFKKKDDPRHVLSNPISSKETRTALHKTIRDLFGGKLDTETKDAGIPPPSEGSRVIIKWARMGRGERGGWSYGGGSRQTREKYLPFIHFTLQKTNRDTQDALGYLARTLHVSVKDLSVAGTKDKRGVTVQRVSLKRNGKRLEDVWNLVHGQKTASQRGQRGIRITDLSYRSSSLELGMLRGNSFVITLRNVKMGSIDALADALDSLRTKGFVNYYGMQRFGTASVPTHAIGLALLQSDWHKAVSLILRKRPGEHPEVEAARHAWLVESNLDRAIELMPRRVVAERCILESYRKQGGDTRNAMGALSTIPRNLRLMYVHAYQSYVWNAIVSERIRAYGASNAVVGDLILEGVSGTQSLTSDGPQLEVNHEMMKDFEEGKEDVSSGTKSRKPYVPPRIKTLTEDDLDHHTIFDVVIPLPGTDVSFPGGALGEKYREFLRMDGLDPSNFLRKQKEYILNGSYRSILHLPKELSWSVLRYTDPDVPLAQADEDKLLGFEPPAVVEDGKFIALQLQINLGTAAYATMALREITRTETGSQYQASLTNVAEDQKYRSGKAKGEVT